MSEAQGSSGPTKHEVVIYRDKGGNTQTWVGPLSDWAAHAQEFGVTEDDVEDQFAFVGECVLGSELWT